MSNCINCDLETNGNFCANCGQTTKHTRIDGHYISHEVQHQLHLEKGFLFTIRELLLRPGTSAKAYIQGNRSKYVKPISFLIITSLIYSLVNGFFHIESQHIASNSAAAQAEAAMQASKLALVFKWVEGHYGYANIMMGGFIALFLNLFFKKHRYNIYEITVLLCFLMGESMLFLALGVLLMGITKLSVIFVIASIILLGYMTWSIGQFFDPKKAGSYVKALLAYLIGALLFYIALTVIGIAWELLSR